MSEEGDRDALAERLFSASVAAFDVLHVYVGVQLGLYQTLTSSEPVTAAELAARAGISERYAREWLEQQAVASILTTEEGTDGGPLRFRLPAGHAQVLCEEDNPAFAAPLALGVVGVANALPAVLEAFRHGGGVPYTAYGADVRRCIAGLNRPMFVNLLATEWFPNVPGLVERLEGDPPARVADVGCGTGWSSIAIARGYPKATVLGVDLDEASVAEASVNASAAGVADRVRFEVRDAADPQLAGSFDLVCAFETIHDMCDPVRALAAMRGLRAHGGTVLVADERVADEFTTEPDDGERFQWGWSALHCLPCAMTDPPAAGTGTIMRTPRLREYARASGYAGVEVLPVENDFWRFYRLVG